MSNWEPGDFNRRSYMYDQENGELDRARRVSVQVKVDNRTLIDIQLREPGILALISRPDEDGIRLEVVEPGGRRFVDVAVIEAIDTTILPWQQQLLFGDDSK